MKALRARMQEARLAVMLLTRLPAGRIRGEGPALNAARWAFVLVGVPVGLIGWGAHAGALALGAAPLMAAMLAISALALVTGALHFDGLADFADGIGGGRDKAHCLEIMRDSRIGSYGALAMILVTGLWAAALTDLAARAGAGWFVAVAMLSRAAMVCLQEALPAARADGLGKFAEGRSWAARSVVILTVLAIATLGGLAGISAILASAIVALAIGALAMRRIGGQTGDVLGAAQLASETACWAVLAVLLPV
ncbi:adenosylcobinamide-GDP ribazoletransferase [Maritimibacter sp. 55A14]|uniref:adenosylcobinamide-GDP ribazoletransferase n=1 Tax=Maritimibacter sp. 55A14 TaxID=2174844 RepID=UPI000D60F3EC|nr:adenosylcobinamide-GDP ribazoletransferase [Maritimibacter sp. 55A14]PWE33013.1 adenosylcobinamide-GDP ribazoletransferase [Maritimibacter sp. 55A14]